jgi:hypothetical protein
MARYFESFAMRTDSVPLGFFFTPSEPSGSNENFKKVDESSPNGVRAQRAVAHPSPWLFEHGK